MSVNRVVKLPAVTGSGSDSGTVVVNCSGAFSAVITENTNGPTTTAAPASSSRYVRAFASRRAVRGDVGGRLRGVAGRAVVGGTVVGDVVGCRVMSCHR
ncbi:hypothetical protein GCM10023169_31260 [Georgenia halophila]|uniref:Uncharacterized protein n=1 Tax=Georgenia halophila TaxID=620889 RepID=A0ABP8LI43_9MICO